MRFLIKLFVMLTLLFIVTSAKASIRVCYIFHGINSEIEQNINISLQLDSTHCKTFMTKTSIHQVLAQNKKNIKTAIEPYGYFNPFIQSSFIFQKNDWLVTYQIDLGRPVQISKLSIELRGPGKLNNKLLHYLYNFPLKEGDIFAVPHYLDAKHVLFNIARNEGYINAHFQNKIIIDPKHHTADIRIVLETGDRYYFGIINFKSDVYAPCFLKRLITFPCYQPYSSKLLGQLQQAMENSYYFKRVIIEPQFNQTKNHQVPIDISYTVPKARTYEVGVGYGTLTGPRLSAKVSLRRVTQTGNHFEAEAKLSSVLSFLSGNYYIPGRNPLTENYFAGINVKKFEPRAGNSLSSTLSGGYVVSQKYTRESITINYLIEHFKIFHHPPSQTSHLFYPDLKLFFVKTDDLVNPNHGIAATFDLSGGTNHFLSSTNYLQADINAKFILSPFSFGRVILRGDLGYTTVHNLKIFPLSKRFFAGGISSIRGFADSSIGPGRYLKIASIEYQNKIHANLYGAIFYDIGTAANHFNQSNNRGVGIGAIYYSMVGPIKLYYAKAVSKKGCPSSIEFSAGPEFS